MIVSSDMPGEPGQEAGQAFYGETARICGVACQPWPRFVRLREERGEPWARRIRKGDYWGQRCLSSRSCSRGRANLVSGFASASSAACLWPSTRTGAASFARSANTNARLRRPRRPAANRRNRPASPRPSLTRTLTRAHRAELGVLRSASFAPRPARVAQSVNLPSEPPRPFASHASARAALTALDGRSAHNPGIDRRRRGRRGSGDLQDGSARVAHEVQLAVGVGAERADVAELRHAPQFRRVLEQA